MLKCSLRWSRWEFCFVSCCHLAATTSCLTSGLALAAELLACAVVIMSFLSYLRDRVRTYYVHRDGKWRRESAELVLGSQTASLSHLGELRDLQLPSVVYLSEFLLVLRFHPERGYGATGAVHIALWPDSLTDREGRRLRRYLKFDLPPSLTGSE